MNMRILLLVFSCNFLCAISEILTHEGIYEELRACQEQQIKLQEKHYKLHQHNSFIMVGVNNASDAISEQLNDAIINLLKDYLEVKKICDMQITYRSSIDPQNVRLDQSLLDFFQNAYIHNHCISNKYKKFNQIFEQDNYKIYHALKSIEDIQQIINSQYQQRQQIKQKLIENNKEYFFWNKFNDIVLISNCLDMMEDYDLFYNECIKYSKWYFGKNYMILIALKLDEHEKQTFNDLHPWDYFVKLNISNDTKLNYETLFLEKRSPLGKFENEKDLPRVLGRKIAKSHWQKEINYYDYCFENKIDTSFKNQQIINSMRCIIEHSNIQVDENFNLFLHNTDNSHQQIYVLNLLCEDTLIKLCIYHTEKLIENLETENKKKFMSTIDIRTVWSDEQHPLVEYTYFKHLNNDTITYSILHDKEATGDDLIQRHKRAKKLVSNLKSHMCNSLMHYEKPLNIYKIIYNDNIYVPHSKALVSSEIMVQWDYLNTYESINTLLSKLLTKSDLKSTFVLYKYDLLTEIGFINQNDKIDMSKQIKDLTKIKEISVGFEFDKIKKQQNYCLQIRLHELGYTQYYYLFLPTYEFQLLNYGYDFNNSLLAFNELLENSKKNIKIKMPPVMSKFYNIVIDKIKQLKTIPKSTILLYLNNRYGPKIDFFIYNVIAVQAQHFRRFTNILDELTEEELNLIKTLNIPSNYSDINIIINTLYQKIMMNLYFKTFH
ncbi:hypothetical protein COBT_003074, partial [Conglomerata obtusa]